MTFSQIETIQPSLPLLQNLMFPVRRRSPVPLRKGLLRLVPAVALSCIGSGIAFIPTFLSPAPDGPFSFKLVVGLLVFILFALFPLLVFVHHMFRLWRWRYWLTIFELIISVIEVTASVLLVYEGWSQIEKTSTANDLDTFSASTDLGFIWLYPGSFVLLTLVCLLSLLTMVWDIMSGHLMDLFEPYHCLADDQRPGWAVLVGVSAMRERFTTDQPWLILLRASVAALTVLAVFQAGLWMILGEPLDQISGSVEIRSFYNAEIGTGFVPMEQGSVHLLVGSQHNLSRFGYNWNEVVDQSLSVSIISQEIVPGGVVNNQFSLDCKPAVSTNEVLFHASVICPVNFSDGHPIRVTYFVSFDFSLLVPGANNGTLPPDLSTTVYLGFSDFPLDVFLNAVPVYLSPGSRILGQAEMVWRDMLKDSNSAVILGLASYRRILVARVYSWPVEDDGVIPLPNNNTGATKISPLLVNPVRYERDFLPSSIFGNLATLGGIWTTLNGVFATIFGTNLLLILFNQKPLSISNGLIHVLLRGHATHITNEKPVSLAEQQRIIGLLREHLLDIPQENQQIHNNAPDPTTHQLLPRHIGELVVTGLTNEEMEMCNYTKHKR